MRSVIDCSDRQSESLTMFNFFRSIAIRTKPISKNWLAGQFEQTPHTMADNAIAAWTEFMGRESAELWIDARREIPQP